MSNYTYSQPFLNGKTWWRVGYDPAANLVTYQWWDNVSHYDERPRFQNGCDGLWRDYRDWPRYNFNDTYSGIPKRVVKTAGEFAWCCWHGQLELEGAGL